MRKIVALLCILGVLQSCTNDNNGNSATEELGSTLLKKTIYTAPSGYTDVVEYFYNGNKLIKTLNPDNTETIYTYSGNRISTTETVSSSGQRIVGEHFTYDSGNNLSTRTELAYYNNTATKYVYQWDNSAGASYLQYRGDLLRQTTYIGYGSEQFNDSDRIANQSNHVYSGTTETYSSSCNFDSKKSPNKNIVGFAKIAPYLNSFGANHNPIARSSTLSSGNIFNDVYNYEYNADDFPRKVSYYFDGEFGGTTEFFYQ